MSIKNVDGQDKLDVKGVVLMSARKRPQDGKMCSEKGTSLRPIFAQPDSKDKII